MATVVVCDICDSADARRVDFEMADEGYDLCAVCELTARRVGARAIGKDARRLLDRNAALYVKVRLRDKR